MSRTSLRRWAAPAIAGSLALVGSVLPVVATPAAAASPDLVISQVYGAGGNSGAVYTHDYVELFNRSGAPVSTAGMSVQYASATGTGSFAPGAQLPARTVPAGGYLLVQMSGGTNGTALPTPDVTGSTSMAAGSGKVALATGTTSLGCNGGSQPCSAEQLARVVDLVGYGGADFFEGSAAAPGLSATTAALRASGGCTDTDVNGADFTAAAPAPRTSSTPVAPCAPSDGPAAPVAACPARLSAVEGEAASAPLSATDADSRVVSASTTSSVPGVTLSPATASPAVGQPATATLSVASTTAAGRYPVEVVFATGDVQVQTVSCTVVVSVADALTIAEVQGPGATSPYEDDLVAIRGVVVGDYQASGEFGGFYVQSLEPDADPRTSEGIRVFVRTPDVAVGDLVQVVGTVDERASSGLYTGSETQLVSSSAVTVLGTADVPAPTPVTLPFAETVGGVQGQERYEGMLVTVTNTDLVATDLYTLGRFGEVSLTTGERLTIPTTLQEAAANDLDRITLDDGLSGQNLPNLPYTIDGAGTTLPRAGDRVAVGESVEGILTFAFGEWRIVPEVGTEVAFTSSGPRPEAPDAVGGDVQVASFNVLNYFVDFDDPARGADTPEELARQQAKLVAAITGLDADVVGLIEIANDDGEALDTLVAALNAAQPDPADHYTAVQAPVLNAPNVLGGTYGTDVIRQAIIYRASVVTPAGPPPSDLPVLDPADPLFPDEPVFDRPPAVQTFRPVGGNHDFTVVVNHFKSKGSSNEQCGTPDPLGGNCDDLRERQSLALVELVEDLGVTKNVMLLGDFNAYETERPIAILQEAGYVSAVADLPREERFSYSFDGEFGTLDYVFLSKSLAKQQTGADIWNINSLEAVALDYNDYNQPQLYRPDAFASSDHDPVLVGLALLPGARGRWTAEQAQARPRGRG